MKPAAKAHTAALLRGLSRPKTACNGNRRSKRSGGTSSPVFEAPAENALREYANNPTGVRCSVTFTALFLELFPLTSQLTASNPLRRLDLRNGALTVQSASTGMRGWPQHFVASCYK
jgi:hypothetical protein